MTAIIHANLIMRDHYIPDAVLLIENEKIMDFGSAKKVTVPENCQIVDAEVYMLVPALWISIPIPMAGFSFRMIR